MFEVQIETIKLNPDMPELVYATQGSAAVDLYADIEEDFELFPGESLKVSTGWRVWIQNPSLVGLVIPRSGQGCKGQVLKNLVGMIDSDYQGELFVVVWNNNLEGSVIVPSWKSGKAFAQFILVPRIKMFPKKVVEFSSGTDRGTGGFGHTDGVKK